MTNRPSEDWFHKKAPSGNRSPSADRLIGAQIDEYRLEELLGSGGMARVYRALDVNLDRAVAIKVIDTPYQADAQYAKRFKREAQAIGQLEHPHIVRLYRYGQAGELFYMAMQFIRGATLADVLKIYRQEQAWIDPSEAARIVREVGEALDYSHSMGVIHRDVKSSNIMLDQQGQAVLADFGLALLANQGPGGDELGSPHYLAPEQALPTARVVPQSDLYSLGVVLFEMFTGQRPYSSSDPMSLAEKHIHELPPLPRSIRPEISPEVEQVIMKALEKRPYDRFQSGQEMAEALEQALAAGPLTAGAAAAGPGLVGRVRQNLTEGFTAAAPLPGVLTSSWKVSTTQTRLGWNEMQRRGATVMASSTVEDSFASRPVRNGWRWPAVLAGLLFLLLCLGLGALAASRLLPQLAGGGSGWDRPSSSSPDLTTGSISSQTEDTQTGTPDLLLPDTGADPTSTADGFVPDTASPGQPETSTVAPSLTATPTPVIPSETRMAPTATDPPPPTATSQPATATDPPSPTETSPPSTATEPSPLPTETSPPPPTATDPPPALTETSPPPPASTDPPPAPTETSPPPPPPAAPGTAYQISIDRRGEDQGWMVITNTGGSSLPLAAFQVVGDKGSLSAGSWGVTSLPPDACLLAWKQERQGSGLPDGITCSQAGSTAWVGREAEGIFKEEIRVTYNGQSAGTCAKDELNCAFVLP